MSVKDGGICIGGKIYDARDSQGNIIKDPVLLQKLAAFVADQPSIKDPGEPEIKHQISTGKLERLEFYETGSNIISKNDEGAEEITPLYTPHSGDQLRLYQDSFHEIMQGLAKHICEAPPELVETLSGVPKEIETRARELFNDEGRPFIETTELKGPTTIIPQEIGGIVEHNPFTIEELQDITAGEWLNETAMDTYMHMLQEKAGEDTIFLTSESWMNMQISGDTTETLTSLIESEDLTNKQIIIPINAGNPGNHWTFAVVDTRGDTNEVTYYDSYQGKTSDGTYKSYAGYWETTAQLRIQKMLEDAGIEATYRLAEAGTEMPQQPNDNDCGVYACHMMRKVALGEDLKTKDPSILRGHVLLELAGNKLMTPREVDAVLHPELEGDIDPVLQPELEGDEESPHKALLDAADTNVTMLFNALSEEDHAEIINKILDCQMEIIVMQDHPRAPATADQIKTFRDTLTLLETNQATNADVFDPAITALQGLLHAIAPEPEPIPRESRVESRVPESRVPESKPAPSRIRDPQWGGLTADARKDLRAVLTARRTSLRTTRSLITTLNSKVRITTVREDRTRVPKIQINGQNFSFSPEEFQLALNLRPHLQQAHSALLQCSTSIGSINQSLRSGDLRAASRQFITMRKNNLPKIVQAHKTIRLIMEDFSGDKVEAMPPELMQLQRELGTMMRFFQNPPPAPSS